MAKLTVFKDSNMSGTSKFFDGPVPDLKNLGFNDVISSLVSTEGRWRLYKDTNFSGTSWDVSATGGAAGTDAYPNPSFWGGTHDSISSLQPI